MHDASGRGDGNGVRSRCEARIVLDDVRVVRSRYRYVSCPDRSIGSGSSELRRDVRVLQYEVRSVIDEDPDVRGRNARIVYRKSSKQDDRFCPERIDVDRRRSGCGVRELYTEPHS